MRWKRDPHRDAVLTDARMHGMYELAAIGRGLTPDEAFVSYPKWAAKWPREYREQIAEVIIKMDEVREKNR